MKINVKGEKYKVDFVKLIDNDEEILGQCHYYDKMIYIKRKAPDISSTIIHEIVHAYLDECGLFKYSEDEELVKWLGCNILKIYKEYMKVQKKGWF